MLFYKAMLISVAFIRGTAADPEGNIIMDRESLTLDMLAIAMATKNNGGLVVAQVEYVADAGTLNARRVKVPGTMIDCVAVAAPDKHRQSLFAPTVGPQSPVATPNSTKSCLGLPVSRNRCSRPSRSASGQQCEANPARHKVSSSRTSSTASFTDTNLFLIGSPPCSAVTHVRPRQAWSLADRNN